MSTMRCESCTLPIETGPYCRYCTDDAGALRSFDETFERFRQWTTRNEPGLSVEETRAKVFAFMAGVPAWKSHPRVLAATRGDAR
jgi:hypothetical protein